ncbi:MAG TPA: glycoside hydrolase family 172 protein [Opitutaceae bacterium]|jgi:hypothetical protein
MKTPHLVCFFALALSVAAQPPSYNPFELGLGGLARVTDGQSRSLSAENPDGAKGGGAKAVPGSGPRDAARELGPGWKVRPAVGIAAHAIFTVADIDGPGAVQQIWMTPTGNWRTEILRFYWDGETSPSVEVPLADFFASGWATHDHCPFFSSLPVCVNPGSAFNCYWTMPFRQHCRITLENLGDERMLLFYQVNYVLDQVPADAAYFHAQFRRHNPLTPPGLVVVLDGVQGRGQYVGTYLAYGSHDTGWWGEGEMKFYIDGDGGNPTICGTGTEDYFCGSYDFESAGADGKHRYTEFSTPYSGLTQVIRPDGLYQSQTRFSLYRWHLTDPVRFQHDLKVTLQDIGWKTGFRYKLLQDDIATVAYWYQLGPHAPFPPLPARDDLETGQP